MESLVSLISALIFFLIIFVLYRTNLNKKSIKDQQNGSILPFNILDTTTAIFPVLKAVMDQKSRFKVRLNNKGRFFNSSLIKVDYPYLFIDGLFPFEGNPLIKKSRHITINFTINEIARIPYTFRSRYIKDEHISGYDALRIKFPEFIERDQKRYYHRIEPHLNNPAHINFILNKKKIQEKIVNISGGGIGFYTNLGTSDLWCGKKLSSVQLYLKNSPLNTGISIVSIMRLADLPVLISGKLLHYYCGVEFYDIDEKMRSKIIKYVIENERKSLKRLSRSFE